MSKIRSAGRPIRVLNLFAYTGGATRRLRGGGRAASAMWTRPRAWSPGRRRTRASAALADAPMRWIVDDCAKFVEREIRRGKPLRRHHHGPAELRPRPGRRGLEAGGQPLPLREALRRRCCRDKPLFVIINSYTTGLAPSVLGYMLHLLVAEKLRRHGHVGRAGSCP